MSTVAAMTSQPEVPFVPIPASGSGKLFQPAIHDSVGLGAKKSIEWVHLPSFLRDCQGDSTVIAGRDVALTVDELLQVWFQERDPLRAAPLFEALMLSVDKTVRGIVGYKLCRRAAMMPDADDVCHTALVRLIAGLKRIKTDGNRQGIKSLTGYAAGIAFNSCNLYFQARYPERHNFVTRARYRLSKASIFGLWDAKGTEVCGFSEWRGRQAIPLADPVRDLLQRGVPKCLSASLLSSVFRLAGGPLEFDALVNSAVDVPSSGIEPFHDPECSSPAPDFSEILCLRSDLRELWKAIGRLPLQQRRALLLNLKASSGADIAIFESSGIATLQEIAEAVGVPRGEFVSMWQELPISDRCIAKLCGMSIQDVINRRSSARKALGKYRSGRRHRKPCGLPNDKKGRAA